jgi:hypothetical protein
MGGLQRVLAAFHLAGARDNGQLFSIANPDLGTIRGLDPDHSIGGDSLSLGQFEVPLIQKPI